MDTAPNTSTSSVLLDEKAAAHLLGLKNPKTLSAWRLRRSGPPYLKLGKRLVRYDAAALTAWASRRDA